MKRMKSELKIIGASLLSLVFSNSTEPFRYIVEILLLMFKRFEKKIEIFLKKIDVNESGIYKLKISKKIFNLNKIFS